MGRCRYHAPPSSIAHFPNARPETAGKMRPPNRKEESRWSVSRIPRNPPGQNERRRHALPVKASRPRDPPSVRVDARPLINSVDVLAGRSPDAAPGRSQHIRLRFIGLGVESGSVCEPLPARGGRKVRPPGDRPPFPRIRREPPKWLPAAQSTRSVAPGGSSKTTRAGIHGGKPRHAQSRA